MTAGLRRRPRRWGHWTLRARLVLVVGALAAVALVVANVAGLVLIRTYLLGRVDDQLRGMSRPFADEHPGGFSYAPRPGRLNRLGPEQVMYVYFPDGTLDPGRSLAADRTRPPVEPIAEVRTHAAAAQPYTIGAADGRADWRVIAIAVPAQSGGGYAVVGLSLSEVQQT